MKSEHKSEVKRLEFVVCEEPCAAVSTSLAPHVMGILCGGPITVKDLPAEDQGDFPQQLFISG